MGEGVESPESSEELPEFVCVETVLLVDLGDVEHDLALHELVVVVAGADGDDGVLLDVGVDEALESDQFLSVVGQHLLTHLLVLGLEHLFEEEGLVQLAVLTLNAALLLNTLFYLSHQCLVMEDVHLALLKQVPI